MEILDRHDDGKMKGIECTQVMREDERLAQPNMGAIQLKQPEFCQHIPRSYGKDLSETFARQQPFLTLPIQSRSQFCEREIGRHEAGAGIGKQPIDRVGTLLNVIAFDESARIDVEERH